MADLENDTAMETADDIKEIEKALEENSEDEAQEEEQNRTEIDQPAVDEKNAVEGQAANGTQDNEASDPSKPAGSPGSSEDPLKMPPHGTEVYVGGLQKTVSDSQIREFCESCGDVYSIRCPKDPGIPGQNRGYAFVTFKTAEQGAKAVETLNQTEMEEFPGKKVRVIMSQVKNRLFIGNVPKDLKRSDMQEVLDKEVRGVTELELLMDREQQMNRGFCFVEFYNHAAADLARKILSRPDFRLRDRILTVTWAEPRKVDSDQEKVKSVYVGNLPESVTDAKLRDIFKAYGEVEKVVLPPGTDGRAYREYGFVHYTERACALKAIEAAEEEKPVMDGNELSVAMAKPPTQTRETAEGVRRGAPGMARGMHMGRMRGWGGMDFEGDVGYDEMEGTYGAYGGAQPSAGYQISGMALVPMYLPNGQVGFVFQQQGMAPSPGPGPGPGPGPMPGRGGPIRTKQHQPGNTRGPYGGGRGDRRGEYGNMHGYGGGRGYSGSRNVGGGMGQQRQGGMYGGHRAQGQSGSRYRPY